MILSRHTALRASSIARCVRPMRPVRPAELPWQRMLQQTGRRGYASPSGHGAEKTSDLPWAVGAVVTTAGGLWFVLNQDLGGHGEEHGEHHAKHEEASDEADESDESGGKSKSPSDSKGDGEENKGDSPDENDKSDPRGAPGGSGTTSGKQEGLSNTDTKHPSDGSGDASNSKKGEGVTETAKLKGTVSTDRPAAENKEERGKSQSDKSK
ncbi:hypothetical protein BCR34DRAFT_478125 [Clohesyomyces aquaticus]|uniref:Uncharacterized protein n=1 Tax=Clohesyomyces aquaticus TaxID=1231657 RepID=A0A1Y1ZZV3_9PLEO|nr:hypothetical protein BCR34DRAFT_478125 [Clohesyomyces aquaticus]